jgi:hypothetical protein
MQLEPGRLERERVHAIGAQVQRRLVRGARTRRCDRSAETDLCRAVNVPAHHALDLRCRAITRSSASMPSMPTSSKCASPVANGA